ncbi:hypothetical protein ACB087_05635 [Vibrio sp. VNB-15]
MINRFVVNSAFTLSIIILAIILYAFINGATCRYSLTLKTDERDTFLTCYRGKVVVLHSKQDAEGNLLSKWKVEARQLRIGSQMIQFVYSRDAIIDDRKEDSNDHFNRISEGYKFLFYNTKRSGDTLYVAQSFPRYYIHVGQIDGKIDIWDNGY